MENTVIFKGIILDMDGLLLDTEKLYVRFWTEAARFYGYPMEFKHALSIRSLNRQFTTEKLSGYFGSFDYQPVHDKRVELMNAYIEEHGVEAKKGAAELLEFASKNGVKIALATSSPFERAKEQLESVGLFKYFQEFACGSMVKNSKPKPDIYLLACEKLELEPKDCMALEDSPNGIKAAYAAGCATVMVPDLDQPTEELLPMLYSVCGDLSQVIPLLSDGK